MALPNSGMDAVPFTPLTAEFLDEIIENIESLSDGSGFDTGALGTTTLANSSVTTVKIADANVTTAKIADANVTPEKRGGGFYIGNIAAATLGSTGNKSITSVGFMPKLVEFTAVFSSSTTSMNEAHGAMTAINQFWASSASATAATTTFSRNNSTAACLGFVSAGSSTPTLSAAFVSMDSDGFTINVTTASSAVAFEFIAYA